jgi:hypothetical protein
VVKISRVVRVKPFCVARTKSFSRFAALGESDGAIIGDDDVEDNVDELGGRVSREGIVAYTGVC